MITVLILVLTILPTPEFCLSYRQGYRAAVCRGMGPLCPDAPRQYPQCPSEGGTPREGYEQGWDAGKQAKR